uniref:Uncharacterized protein n=1 Tax=Brassica campestris TaxID=3711 RepID=A0A3P6DAN6_BRACM|nr:unnamed protein product [Brassica rapa]
MDNQSIFKYSWETLPKKWVKKWKDRNMGIDRYQYGLPISIVVLSQIAYLYKGSSFDRYFAELIIPPKTKI